MGEGASVPLMCSLGVPHHIALFLHHILESDLDGRGSIAEVPSMMPVAFSVESCAGSTSGACECRHIVSGTEQQQQRQHCVE